MKLPLLLSVPHAGLCVPDEVRPWFALTRQEIVEDSDEGAAAIYALADEVVSFHDTDVARAVVDLNRAEDDRRADGVVKTHTCWQVPVYHDFPPDDVVEALLERHYRPYHALLRETAGRDGVRLAVDCHTMAANGPPIGPDPGVRRPRVCLSNADGTCPEDWIRAMAACFRETFGDDVTINTPFRGGFITRSHAAEMPWIQLELSRAPFFPDERKRACVLQALDAWCRWLQENDAA